MLGMFRSIHKLIRIKSFDRGSNLAPILAYVPVGKLDPLETGPSLNQTFPVSLFPKPDRSNWANSCHHHTLVVTIHGRHLSKVMFYCDCLPSFLSSHNSKKKMCLLLS